MSVEFQDFYEDVIDIIKREVNSEKYARSLGKKNYFRIKTGFYEDESPEYIAKQLKFQTVEDLNESATTDLPVRTVVRDLMFLIKKREPGEFYLPEDVGVLEAGYNFKNFSKNVPYFSVIFHLSYDNIMKDDYKLSGSLMSDNDTIYVGLVINPTKYPQSLFDINADLNDLIAHELEHVRQHELDLPETMPDDYLLPQDSSYYRLPWEVPAQIKGFRRIVKLRKEPVKKVITDWFKRNKSKIDLDEDEVEEIIDFLTQKYYEYYGRK